MSSYSDWPTISVAPLDVRLDDKNPRLSVEGESQAEIREALLENADVLGLAKSICRSGGVYPQDLPILVKEGTKHVVLEGNRRFAAVQLLLDSNLVPEKFKETWPAAPMEVGKALKRVKAILAPSRKVAEPLIARTHAFNARREWAALARMRYAHVALKSAGSVADVANDLGVNEAEIRRLARRFAIYLYVLELKPAWSKDEVVILGREASPVSVLVYPFEREEVRDLVGDTFDAEGQMISKVPKKIVDRGMKLLARHALIPLAPSNRCRLSTRGGEWGSLEKYFMSEQKEWVEAAAAKKISKGPSGLTTPPPRPSPPAPAPKQKKQKPAEFFEDFQVPSTTSHRIKQITVEITQIQPTKYPLSAALLMRMLLEIVLVEHLKKKKRWSDYKGTKGEKAGLQDLCNFVISERLLTEKELHTALQKFRDSHSPLLGLVAHSDYGVLNGPAVMALKPFVRPIIEGVIAEWGE